MVEVPLELGTASRPRADSMKKLDAVVALEPSLVSCGVAVALLGADPHGDAVTPAVADLFSGVIRVRGLCGADGDASSVSARRLEESTPARTAVPAPPPPKRSSVFAFNASLPTRGGGNCSSSKLRSLIFGAEEGDNDCKGGVCCGGVCSCAPGFYGEYCDIHVDCGHVPLAGRAIMDGNASQYDNRSCTLTAPHDSSWANCSCSAHEGDFALCYSELRDRWLPSSNVQLTAENLRTLRKNLRTRSSGWLVVFGVIGLWLLASACALHQDCRHAYVQDIPQWLHIPERYRWVTNTASTARALSLSLL
jgi:hypothetical protein